MATVVTDIIPDPLTGATFYRVSRVFPSAASAARGVMLLESVVPQAFGPPDVLNQATNVAETATPEGVLTAGEFLTAAGVAAQAIQFAESHGLARYDDDEGLAPGEPPRCRAMGSCD